MVLDLGRGQGSSRDQSTEDSSGVFLFRALRVPDGVYEGLLILRGSDFRVRQKYFT